MKNLTITSEIILNNLTRREIAKTFNISTLEVLMVEKKIDSIIGQKTEIDKEIEEELDELDSFYPIYKKVNRKEIAKQLDEILKNPGKHRMEEWVYDAQNEADQGKTRMEIDGHFTKTGNPCDISIF